MTLLRGITTVAGTLGTPGYSGDGSAATSGYLQYPYKTAIDSAGNLYIADQTNNRIQKVAALTGIMTTVAGSATGASCGGGTGTVCGDGEPATSALLNSPYGVAVDSAGNLYISDSNDYRIRMVSAATGYISTIVGTGALGNTGNGGLPTSATIKQPEGLVLDGAGNLYFADSGNSVVRKVTPDASGNLATGTIALYAGSGSTISNGQVATSSKLNNPADVALDSSGNLYIADASDERIRKVTTAGLISTVAGTATGGYTGDGGAATSAELNTPTGVSVDSAGNIYIADEINYRVRVVNAQTGIISTLAGSGSANAQNNVAATAGGLNQPHGVAVDAAGNLYISDTDNNGIREASFASFPTTAIGSSATARNIYLQLTAAETITSITVSSSQASKQEFTRGTITGCTVDGVTSNASGAVCTVPITFTPAYPGSRNVALTAVTSTGTVTFSLTGTGIGPLVSMTPGIITTVAGTHTPGYSGDGGPATSAKLNGPSRLAVDSAGNLYIADTSNHVIRKVTLTTGYISTVAGTATVACSAPTASPACGDTGLATSATLNQPQGVAVDAAGNLYIDDYSDYRIRLVTAGTGIITTFAGTGVAGYSGDGSLATSAELYYPFYVALDSQGNVYSADALGGRIRETYTTTGVIKTIAGDGTGGYTGDGGAATSAEMNHPYAMAFDSSGNLYIADNYNNVIREVNATTHYISTVAGSSAGTSGYSGDGGLATSATLNSPKCVVLDPAGNLYIADTGNNVIREVNAGTGIITTIAGNNTASYSGDSGPATSAALHQPSGLALDSSGNLYIADSYNNVIRKITAATAALTFPTATAVGSSDATDDPLTATVQNIGNSSLTILPPSSGSNASISANFAFDSSSICSELYAAGSSYTLASSGYCTIAVDFKPTTTGSLTGTASLTDNSLNTTGTTQIIALSGTGSIATTTAVASSANPSITGSTVTFTATVTQSSGNTTPAGTIQFTIDGSAVGSAITLTSGAASYSTSSLAIGTHTVSAVYMPGATSYFLTSTSSTLTQTVSNQITPTITWATPSSITYGTALSSTQLNATASVAGTFVYSPASGTVLGAGSQTLSTTFTPTDAVDYSHVTKTVTLTVTPATPTVTWSTPSPITYGIALSSTQLNAVSSVAGSFVYSPASGTVLGAGSQTLTVTFTPTDTTDYNSPITQHVTLAVSKATPSITWAAPSAIAYGTALSGTQLDATSSVSGAFTYTPASGTVEPVGINTLSVTFTPTNTTDYNSPITASVTLTVSKATPSISWATPSAITYGTALSSTQLNATATSSGSTVAGTFVYSPASGSVLNAGSQTLDVTFTPTNTTDYNSPITGSTTLTVNQATGSVALTSSAASVGYGSSLTLTAAVSSGGTGTVTFEDGSSSIGTATLSAGAATLTLSTLSVGSHTLSAIWSGDTDHTSATSSALTQVVTRAAAAVAFTSARNPSIYGDSVTWSIAVTGSSATPTGTVTLSDLTTGTTLTTLTLSAGAASYSSQSLSAGSHSLQVVYNGDSNFY